jgi:hypothetical protein
VGVTANVESCSPLSIGNSSSSTLGTAMRNSCSRNYPGRNKATHTHDNTVSVRSYSPSLESRRPASRSTIESLALGSPPQTVWKGGARRATYGSVLFY